MEMLVPWKRKVKNVVCQYNDTQIKVRDATSNDPCNPALGVLIELADLSKRSYELVSIMQVIWKRVNDRGNNWRHCYKSLFVLEYLVKMGDPQVYQQCKQNFRALQVLTQFQFVDECGKDVGVNVRQKAIQVLELLTNDAKLQEEREKEVKNREKHEKMQQQVRQQQLLQQQQQQQALGSKSMPLAPKGTDTYVHRLDRNTVLHASSGGYDDPYGGATGSYPSGSDYGAAAQSYDQQYAYNYGAEAQHGYSYGAVSNPFQCTQNSSEQHLQPDAMLSFGSSPEEVKQRMATNPFLCDFAAEPEVNTQPAATAADLSDQDFFASFETATFGAPPPPAPAPAPAPTHQSDTNGVDANVDQLAHELRDVTLSLSLSLSLAHAQTEEAAVEPAPSADPQMPQEHDTPLCDDHGAPAVEPNVDGTAPEAVGSTPTLPDDAYNASESAPSLASEQNA